MMKLLVSIFVILFFCSCGVDTSSNQVGAAPSSGGSQTNTDTTLDLIDPNPIHSGSNTGENNTTNDTNGTGGTGGTGGTTVDPTTSTFDTVGAVYDAKACNASSYLTARDASYNGINTGENGANFFSVAGQGLEIRSEHLEGESANAAKTWVTLFYKSFSDKKSLGLQGDTAYLMEGVFYLIYDIAWSDESIGGIDNVMYVRSDIGTKPACYRLGLNSIVGTQIDVQKVYR